MKDELVSRELAVLLKEKGFGWGCNKRFNIQENIPLDGFEMIDSLIMSNWNMISFCVSIPTQSLAQRWFREVHNISVEVWYSNVDKAWLVDVWILNPICEIGPEDISFKTYEEALEYGLMKAIKEVKPCK